MRHDRGNLTRRDFLRTSIAVGATVPFANILAACSTDPIPGEPGVELARPGSPVTLPLFEDLPLTPDGLGPETGGIFRIYGWPLYIKPTILATFEDRYDVHIEWVRFDTMTEAMARLRNGGESFDLFFPTLDVLGRLAGSKQLLPVNHSYLGNLQANVWPSLRDPFYDRGSRYTVPYVVWTTGISWRNDLMDSPMDLPDPYGVFWDSRLRGRVHILSEAREALALALLRDGITDFETGDPAVIDGAKDALLDLVDLVAPEFDHTDYKDMYSGHTFVHQSWSGNIGFADAYAPQPRDIRNISYGWPGADGRSGIIGSDTLAIPASTTKPVLAHLLMNMLLEPAVALENVGYEGFQQPLDAVDPDRLVHDGSIPPSLASVIVREEDFSNGYRLLELSPQADELWQHAWGEVTQTRAMAGEPAIP